MNEANFVSRVSSLITGDFFLAEKEIPLHAFRDTNTGLTLGPDGGTGATVVTPTAVVNGLSFDDGETAILQFMIPQDYEQGSDKAALRFVVVPSSNAQNTTDIGITAAQSVFRAGAAVDSTAAVAVVETPVSSNGQLVREVVLDISDRAFQPGDIVQLVVDVNNAGTPELIVLGAALIYGSVFRAYNDDDNHRILGS